MKILVDARELGGKATGVGRYLREILKRWGSAALAHPYEVVLCAPNFQQAPDDLGFRRVETGHAKGGTWWEQVVLPQIVTSESPAVLFCPAYTAPLRVRVPVVVTIHDISFVAHPEWYSIREGVRRRLLTRAAARHATAVITDSDFSAAEISQWLGVPSARLHVIRLGVPPRRPAAVPVARDPLVLFVGSIFNRRHVPDLLSAFRGVVPHVREARLVVVGENRTQPRQDLAAMADRLGLSRVVEFTDYVSEERLAELYARAKVFVFVSEYEGFGLPPLEALASGIPPIVADTPVAHETCGRAGLYVRPGDIDASTRAIRTLLTDDRERLRIFEAAPGVLARYSWDRAAEATLRVLEQAARS